MVAKVLLSLNCSVSVPEPVASPFPELATIARRLYIAGVVSVSKPQRSLFGFRDETQSWLRNLGIIFFFAVVGGAYLVVTLFSRPVRTTANEHTHQGPPKSNFPRE